MHLCMTGSDRVLLAERTGELQYVARLSGRRGAVAKASLKRAWTNVQSRIL